MWIWLFNFFFHNMLLREIALVVLMVWVIIRFYHEYMRAANSRSDRVRRFGTRNIVLYTRKVLLALAIIFALVMVYDRVLPHWGIGAEQALTGSDAIVTSSSKVAQKSSKSTKAKSSSKSSRSVVAKSSSKSKSSTKKSSSKQSSAKKRVAKKSSQKASSKSSSVKQYTRGSKATAVAIVKQYFKKHPHQKSSDIDTFKYAGKTTAYDQVAYQVGGYAKGSTEMLHLFYVYEDGRIATVY
ncbi:hypothetical protein [uncultured Lacticaseibacillus sp.]|uniref:hypothetical protein n=1 Tax=uncultured Lacticaseibacillus sp. TaxID=2775882 RepID=UPI002593BFF3|nr:hypothetical protein [uncultured Lacticaseibacillus sp.]